GPAERRGPAHGVHDDLLDLGLVVDRQGLVARAEVEDLAPAALVGAAAAEDLPALIPVDKHERVRSRHVEGLAVHLGVRDLEVFAKTGGDEMARRDDPDPLLLADLAPGQAAARPHQAAKDLREVPGVED